uniref:guanylate cyclase n=1 Tax=Timema cristinae TaxID=61476 RepID=A0A7R9CZB2_TIMCR|nr:unnamed protein product [Timema cristinae]
MSRQQQEDEELLILYEYYQSLKSRSVVKRRNKRVWSRNLVLKRNNVSHTVTILPELDADDFRNYLNVARHFYHKEMRIELVREEILFDTVHVTFQLTFDNRAFTLASLTMTREEKHLPISASMLFEIFPFCIVFGSDMVVRSMGNSLMVILPDLVSKKITNWFDLVRPLIAFKFETVSGTEEQENSPIFIGRLF